MPAVYTGRAAPLGFGNVPKLRTLVSNDRANQRTMGVAGPTSDPDSQSGLAPNERGRTVPRIIILATSDLSDEDARITLDESISVGLLSDDHVARQLVERLRWGAKDAERVEGNELAVS